MIDPAALEPQIITIPLVRGLDTKTDPEVMPAPGLQRLENASFFNPGVIAKDDGYTAISTTNLTTPLKRFVAGDAKALIAADCKVLSEYSPGADIWRNMTPHASPLATAGTIRLDDVRLSYGDTLTNGDYAISGPFAGYITTESSGEIIKAQIRDESSGSVLYRNCINENYRGVGTPTEARVINVGTFLVFVWCKVSTNTLYGVVWDSNNPTAAPSSKIAIVTDSLSTAAHFDVIASQVQSNRIWIAYTKLGGSGTKLLRVDVTSSTLSVGASLTHGDSATQWIGLAEDTSGNVLCAYQGSAVGTKMFGATQNAVARSSSTLAVADVDGLRGCVVFQNTSTAFVFWEKGTGTVVSYSAVAADGSGGAISIQKIYFQTLTHRAVLVDSAFLIVGLAYFDRTLAAAVNQRTLWTACVDLTSYYIDPICFYLYDIVADPSTWTCNNLVNVIGGNTPEYRFLGAYVGSKSGDVSTNDAVILNRILIHEGQATSVSGTPIVANSLIYSGGGPMDATIGWAPTISITFSASGGSGLVNGATYQWLAVYELIAPDGTVVVSIPSNIVTATVPGANQRAEVSITNPINRGSDITGDLLYSIIFKVYRTQAGPGANFNLVAGPPGNTIKVAISTVIFDTSSDATIAANQLVYTSGGVLPAYPWPTSTCLTLYQNRLFTIDEFTNEIRYTRDIVSGEAPAWHPDLALDLNGQNILGKALVNSSNGLWVLGRDLVSGAGAVVQLLGDGPDDTGTSSSYVLQRFEAVDVGPAHWRQCVTTPAGVFFEDPFQGFHILQSGGGPATPVGLPVEAERTPPTSLGLGSCQSMVVLQDRKEVRCMMQHDLDPLNPDRLLVYHYDQGVWSVRKSLGFAADALAWEGSHIQMTTSVIAGQQLRRTSGNVFQDEGAFYPLVIGTGWIRVADIAGLQRVWAIYLCGKYKSSTSLTVNLYYDGSSSADTYTFSTSDLADNSGDLKLKIRPRVRKMERFRIEIIDNDSGADSREGAQWNALRIEYGALKRGTKPRTTGLKG